MVTCILGIFSGCSSARYVLKEPDTGVIAIASDTPRNREKATALMAQHFPAGYVIDREEETVIGQVTHHQTDHGKSVEIDTNRSVESGQSSATATTVDKTEYRIFYRRR